MSVLGLQHEQWLWWLACMVFCLCGGMCIIFFQRCFTGRSPFDYRLLEPKEQTLPPPPALVPSPPEAGGTYKSLIRVL